MEAIVNLSSQPWHSRSGIVARLFSPLGRYPDDCIGYCDAGFLFDREASVMAVRYKDFPLEEVGYSEMQWAKSEEIAFMASITLARELNENVMVMYPEPEYRVFTASNEVELSSPDVLWKIREILVKEFSEDPHLPEDCRYGRHPALPPALGGPLYFETTDSFLPSVQKEILNSIQTDDHLLIRGLSTFLRSYMVSLHPHLVEEATLALYISLEASFRLVLRKLSKLGIKEPSAKDAAEYVAKQFGDTPLERYFADYYDDRITTLHPESRFGIYPHAPLCVDDCYDLQEGLFAMYNLLTSGRINLGS